MSLEYFYFTNGQIYIKPFKSNKGSDYALFDIFYYDDYWWVWLPDQMLFYYYDNWWSSFKCFFLIMIINDFDYSYDCFYI